MANDGFVQTAPDGTGKIIDTSELVVGARTVERQRVVLADDSVAAGIAKVQNAQPGETDYGITARIVSFGAEADSAATSDAGTFSAIALIKRLLGKIPVLGSAIGASSLPVVIASDQSALSIYGSATTASGNITTQNLVPSGAATAGSAVAVTLNGAPTLAIQVTGTYTGALSLQVTLDGTNWITVSGIPFINLNTGGYLSTITSALASVFQCDVAGAAQARITGLAAMTGTAVVTLRAVNGGAAMVALDAALPAGTNSIGVVDTELPAAAAIADGLANPTTPQIASDAMLYNGATWDRARPNWNTTTGDTGAKTTTLSGATQTNYNAAGAIITILMGTVSGTSPTCAPQLQWSPDAGTTWINYGPAMANITATGQYTFIVYPANMSASAGSTPANLTTGATTTVAIDAPLPRTWRVLYTIAGTTPSFTITSVQVNYIN